ncbi:hypothetical protein DL95DRAFT_53994 [Leptodontidium sp. 2 PMI_412]|nr:hypothetical protein DL95DRAFT_53994 [Leptodontidium sp. 2 PMI_412]
MESVLEFWRSRTRIASIQQLPKSKTTSRTNHHPLLFAFSSSDIFGARLSISTLSWPHSTSCYLLTTPGRPLIEGFLPSKPPPASHVFGHSEQREEKPLRIARGPPINKWTRWQHSVLIVQSNLQQSRCKMESCARICRSCRNPSRLALGPSLGP